MNNLNYIGIIPARYASSRFPGKPLVKICGISMIERVYKRAKQALDQVIVATDDIRIYNAVKKFGGEAVMTSPSHKSGTDRCLEAYQKIGSNADVVINIQGDEPFISPTQIETIKNCFDSNEIKIATLVKEFNSNYSFSQLEDPNTPKVIVTKDMFAQYFSRSIIPYIRGIEKDNWTKNHKFYTHVGMYAYRISTLKEITSLQQSNLEIAESLEQLRWIENGYKIKVGITNFQSIGIDTPKDLELAEKYINTNNI
ncbi:MAG: 3-deoxy-manno-octulosonate cytidylyltransferase [Muribaculaceae bacterium]|nr:3-deoxy-manno-octulosonate cytidylyltransferase [Muribaculaceae bacterium]